MIKLTAELRSHMTKNFGMAADASDDVARLAVGDALASGKLDHKTYTELTTTKGEAAVRAIVDEQINKALAPVNENITKILEAVSQKAATPATPAAAPAAVAAGTATVTKDGDAPNQTKAYAAGHAAAVQAAGSDGASTIDTTNAHIRHKSILEQFDDTRSAATYDRSSNGWLAKNWAGKPVRCGGESTEGMAARTIDLPTRRKEAISGAWLKWLVNKDCRTKGIPVPRQFALSELDTKLCEAVMHECQFVGPIGYKGGDQADHWCAGNRLNDYTRKALIDDNTSGGLEAVPIEFDDMAILTPLLNGELFPLVNLINVTRRRIEGFSVGNPTLTWGQAEASGLSLFNTSGLVAAFDNSIYPVMGAIEMGLDFLADSPADIGAILANNYGEQFKKALDTVIAAGDGSTQPEGVFVKSGTTSVSTTGGNGAAPTMDDYEKLLFAIPKELRQEAGQRAAFLSTDVSYRRSRGIAVDSTADARRMFVMYMGEGYESYRTMGHPHKINVTGLTNAKIGYFCFNRYRMYRRQGYEVILDGTGQTSRLKHTQILVVRARFGGALGLATAGAKITDAQS